MLELSAGAGDLVGGSFEQIRDLIKNAESNVKFRNMVNVCVDTCHAFAAGYDLRAKADVEAMVKRFDAIVGLKRLKLLHGNDSKFGLGDHRDRHEHIGKGTIGKEAFRALLHMSKLKNVDMIVETPDDGNQDDIRVLKQLRSS